MKSIYGLGKLTGPATKDANGNGAKGNGGKKQEAQPSAKTLITVPPSYPAASRRLSPRSAHGGNGSSPRRPPAASAPAGNGAGSAAEREALLKQQQEYLKNREADLKAWAEGINKRYTTMNDRLFAATRRSVEDATWIGEKLVKAKEAVGHTQWMKWKARNLTFSDEIARRCMRAYENKDDPKFQLCRNLTDLWRLLGIIAPRPKSEEKQQPRKVPHTKDEKDHTVGEWQQHGTRLVALWPMVDERLENLDETQRRMINELVENIGACVDKHWKRHGKPKVDKQ